jgi:tetratricopeptide (TPR) repeat protein
MHELAAAAVGLGPTPVGDALAWLEKALAEDPGLQPLLGVWRATTLARIGRFDEARALYAQTVDQLRERGMTTWVAISSQEAWNIEMLAGDPIAAERVARQGCEQLERLGERAWLSTQACQLADALYALGRYKESEEWVSRGLELGGGADVATQMVGLQVRSKLLVRQGDHRQALELAERADTLARATDAPVFQGDCALALAEVRYLGGDRTRGDAEVQRAIDCYQRKGATACITRVRSLAATLRDPLP